MTFVCLPFNDLSITQLYAILQLRSEVFVVEQACIYQDMDQKDIQAGVHHLMMFENDELVAYSRLLPAGLSYPTVSIGRIVVVAQARKTGLGRKIIQESINKSQDLWPKTQITIGAQSHLSALYQSFGFVEVSEHYLEDDILHVDMLKAV
jgi:ElaA protein